MGVPVLTVAGNSMVSRQAAAVLTGIGEKGWICTNGAEMAEQAEKLSRQRDILRERRLQQRAKVAASPCLIMRAWPAAWLPASDNGGRIGWNNRAGRFKEKTAGRDKPTRHNRRSQWPTALPCRCRFGWVL